MSTPEKLTANEILKKHGPAGWLIRRLQTYAMFGWIIAFIILAMFFLTNLARTLAGQPVVAVDEGGKVLGTLEYLKPSTRSDQEIKAASKRFMQLYLSLNSETIFEDYAAAMNLMSPEFMAETSKALKEDNYLARVAQAKTRSWIETLTTDGITIIEHHNLDAQVRLKGNIFVDAGGGRVEKPFDVTLAIKIVPRTTNNTSGIQILSRKDN